MLRVGTFVGDRYEILGKIGSGGMSDVYKAKCHKLNRLVALKVLKQEFCSNQSFVTRFKVEAQAAAKLTHPNIVAIYDVGDEGNLHYIVMELVEGITLKDYIARKGRLENRETIGISIQVAQGLEAAHAQNIVHRDIKPQNIIISREGKVKVMDFGIAKAVTGDTINSEAIGSVHYISPEQARGGYCDSRSDLYSLGITMYEMLTGSVPFDGENTVSVALAHLQTPMTPPGKQIATVTRSLDKIVLKCTQKAPENRYASATALITDLRKALTMPEGDFVILPPAALREYETAMAADGTTETESIPQAVLPVQDDLDWTEQAETANPEEEEEEAPLFDPEKEDSYAYEDDDENEDDDYFGNIPEEEDDEEAPTKGDRISLIVSIVLGVIIALLGLYLALRMTGVISSGTDKRESTSTEETETLPEGKTRMPDLIGMEEDEAKQALKEAGLGMTTEYESSDTVKEGLVMRQEYDEDEIIDKNIKVVVTISEGSSSVQIPTTILGKTKDEANAVLKDLNLSDKNITVSYVDQSSDTYAEGTICGMNPSSGIVSSDSTLTLYVSSGKAEKTVSVPSVEGLEVNTAISSLTGAGLSYNQVEASSDTVASGLVISQSVASGTEVAEGTVITLTVSTGKADVYVPGVVGMAQAQAINALEQRGIAYNISVREVSDVSQNEIVLEQSVGADSVYDGGVVVLYVGQLQAQTGVLSVGATNSYEGRVRIIQNMNLDLNVTRVDEYSDSVKAGDVISMSPGEGSEVKRGSTIVMVVSLGPEPQETEAEQPATGE